MIGETRLDRLLSMDTFTCKTLAASSSLFACEGEQCELDARQQPVQTDNASLNIYVNIPVQYMDCDLITNMLGPKWKVKDKHPEF